MSDGDALLAAVVATPFDAAPRLIYADWLDEHDRPSEAAMARTMPMEWLESLGCRPEKTLIADWTDGLMGFTLPWAIRPARRWGRRRFLIRGDYPVRTVSFGTCSWPLVRSQGRLYSLRPLSPTFTDPPAPRASRDHILSRWRGEWIEEPAALFEGPAGEAIISLHIPQRFLPTALPIAEYLDDGPDCP